MTHLSCKPEARLQSVCVQVIKPIKTASGVAAFVLSAAAAMQLIASPPAGIPNATLVFLMVALPHYPRPYTNLLLDYRGYCHSD